MTPHVDPLARVARSVRTLTWMVAAQTVLCLLLLGLTLMVARSLP
jgi:hypothetical protein